MKIWWNRTECTDDSDIFKNPDFPDYVLIHQINGDNKGWYMVKLDSQGRQLSGMIDIYKTAKACLQDFHSQQ
jgi:hypothetical protein